MTKQSIKNVGWHYYANRKIGSRLGFQPNRKKERIKIMKKNLVDEKATRHDVTRHCEEGKHSAARRGNLLNGLLRHFVPRNDGISSTPQSLLNVKNLTSYRLNEAAFTLAEVLITLAVIGIVAAMTIPTLISNYQEKVTVTKLKKVYSVLNQAYSMAIQENGDPTQWGLSNAISVGGSPDDEDYEEKLSEYFKNATKPLTYILPYLKTDLVDNVIDYPRFSMDGTEFGYFKRYAVLPDGVYIVLSTVISSNCSENFGNNLLLNNVCGEIGVDLNGVNPPNATGKDVFLFYYTKYGIIPMGSKYQTRLRTFASDCNLSQKSNLNGYGCTAWVIENGNMDYLHCDDLSWDGKHKCSD